MALVNETEDDKQQSTSEDETDDGSRDSRSDQENEIHLVDVAGELRDEFKREIKLQFPGGASIVCIAQIDTGCPVTLIQEQLVNTRDMVTPGKEWNGFRGINNSKLLVNGVAKTKVTIDSET